MVVHTHNPNIKEADTGKSRVQGQPRLHDKTLSQQNKTKTHKTKK
jgi:hypothetical protein